MLRHQLHHVVFVISPLIISATLFSDVSSSHGLDDLIARIGIDNIPTGLNVEVGQVEADNANGDYGPDVDDVTNIGKTFIFRSGTTGISNHATQVGKRVYGISNVGIAPSVDLINVYSAEGWVLDYLRMGSSSNPQTPPGNLELFNNSWIGSFGNIANDNQALRRADWSADTHDIMILNGVASADEHSPLMSFGFNCVSVGLENGTHIADAIPAGYELPGRQIPLIVAVQNTTSNSTGVVSAITALLVETRETHPNTQDNFFAGFSETMKAVLLTGGKHNSGWTNNPDTSGPNRGRTIQPIDAIYGVGTANIDRSYRVLTGGQHSSSTSPSGLLSAPIAAWETTTLSNNQSKYIKFTVASLADEVSIVLTWHQRVNSGFASYSFADMDLELLQYNNGKPTPLVGDSGLGVFGTGNVVSESDVDNVEHLYIQNLSPGEYVLKIHRLDTVGGSRVFSVGWLFPEQDGVPGDLNGDGVVDVNDLLVIIAGWGACAGDCPADLNGDGVVNVVDILALLSYWS